jgi:hypothetical protein
MRAREMGRGRRRRASFCSVDKALRRDDWRDKQKQKGRGTCQAWPPWTCPGGNAGRLIPQSWRPQDGVRCILAANVQRIQTSLARGSLKWQPSSINCFRESSPDQLLGKKRPAKSEFSLAPRTPQPTRSQPTNLDQG